MQIVKYKYIRVNKLNTSKIKKRLLTKKFVNNLFFYYLLDNDSLYLSGVIFTRVLNILMK